MRFLLAALLLDCCFFFFFSFLDFIEQHFEVHGTIMVLGSCDLG
jgi:hypothetical protein